MAVYGYARVSTGQQHTENQLLCITEKSGYTVDKFFEDKGVSGSTPALERPAFKELFELLKEGDTLLVSKTDRLSRDLVNSLQTIQQILDKGVNLVFLSLGTSPIVMNGIMGKMLIVMSSLVSEWELHTLKARTREGLERTKKSGTILGRPISISKNKIEKIQRLYKEEGYTQQMLSERFNISAKTIGKLLKMSPEEIEERENLREKQKRQIRDNK